MLSCVVSSSSTVFGATDPQAASPAQIGRELHRARLTIDEDLESHRCDFAAHESARPPFSGYPSQEKHRRGRLDRSELSGYARRMAKLLKADQAGACSE